MKVKTMPLSEYKLTPFSAAIARHMQEKVNSAIPWPSDNPEPLPKRKADVVDISTKRRQVDAANDEKLPRRKRKGDRFGGEPPCQDQDLSLKAWLAAYNPIPNNVCYLVDKERHVQASENSKRVRLIKYGDSNYRPSLPPEWEPRSKTDGWWGQRPPTLDQLYTYSRKIAEKLGPYEVDRSTVLFVKNNLGKSCIAPPDNDPLDIVKECTEISIYEQYLSKYPEDFIMPDRKLLLTQEFLEQLNGKSGERPKPVVSEEKVSHELPLILSKSKAVSPVVLISEGQYERTESVTLRSASFKDERTRLRRTVKVKPWAVSYRDIEYVGYADEEVESASKSIDDELRYYLSQVEEPDWVKPIAEINEQPVDVVRETNSPPIETAKPLHIAELRRGYDKDYIKYRTWLRYTARFNKLVEGRYTHRTFFSICPSDSERERLDHWLGRKSGFNKNPDLSRYDQYWLHAKHRDEKARLDAWFLSRPMPPKEVKKISSKQHMGDTRYNLYVDWFNKYFDGEMTLGELNRKSYSVWATYWGSEIPDWVLSDETFDAWEAYVTKDEDQEIVIDDKSTLLVPIDSANHTRAIKPIPYTPNHQAESQSLNINHAGISRRVSEYFALEREKREEIRHLSLKRGFRNIFRAIRKEPVTSTEQHDQSKAS